MVDLATTFQHVGVATAYVCRPPYPPEVFDILDDLIVDAPRHVLDIGAGDGALARPMAERVERVDAVEISQAMVGAGRRQLGGDRSNLMWILDAAETMAMPGPYALVTAGASLHWMDATVTLDYVGRHLTSGGMLAIVNQEYHEPPWRRAAVDVIVAHSRSQNYKPAFSLPDDLQRRGLFDIRGRRDTAPMEFRQPVRDYIEQFHSTSSLARELMPPDEADRFDREIEAIVRDYADADGILTMNTIASVVWGLPIRQN